jgi:hypothetical protein
VSGAAIPINTLVRLDFGGEQALLPSRVEDVDNRDVLLAAVSQIGVTQPPEPGATLIIQWTGPRGVCSVPAEFLGAETAAIRLWRVRVAGGIDVLQRRRFARVATGGAISLDVVTGDDEPRALMGWMLNLSEGGVALRATAGESAVGDRVRIRMSLERQRTELGGEVLRLVPSKPGYEEVVVAFDHDERCADLIRKFVMQQLVRQRRAGLS